MQSVRKSEKDTLVLRDNLLAVWLFDLFFVGLGGSLVLTSFVWWDSWALRILSLATGFANLLGGLRLLWLEPWTCARLSRQTGMVELCYFGLSGFHRRKCKIEDIGLVDVVKTRSAVGGGLYRVTLHFQGGKGDLPLSQVWLLDRNHALGEARQIREFLRQ